MLAKFFVALFKQNQCSSCKGNLLAQLKIMSTSKRFVANIFTIKYVVKKFSIKTEKLPHSQNILFLIHLVYTHHVLKYMCCAARFGTICSCVVRFGTSFRLKACNFKA